MQVSKSKVVALFVACGVDTAVGWDDEKLSRKVADGVEKYGREATLPREHDALYRDLVDAQARSEPIEIVSDETGPAKTPDEVSKPAAKSPKTNAAAPKTKSKGKSQPAKKVATKPANAKNPKTAAVKAAVAKKNAASAPVPDAPKKVTAKPKVKPAEPVTNGKPGKVPKVGAVSWCDYKKYRQEHPQQVRRDRPGIVLTIVEMLEEAGRKNVPVLKKMILEALVKQFPDRVPEKMMQTINNRVPTYMRQCMGMDIRRDYASGGYYIPPVEQSSKAKKGKQTA